MIDNIKAICYNEYIAISEPAELWQDNELIGLKVMTNAKLRGTADILAGTTAYKSKR